MKKLIVIVPFDNETVYEEIKNSFPNLELIKIKMEKTNETGLPANINEAERVLGELTKVSEYAKNISNIIGIVYGRGFGTYTQIGRKQIKAVLEASGVPVIIPTEIILDELKKRKAKNIVLLTPYTPERMQVDIDMYKEAGFNIIKAIGLGINHGPEIANINKNAVLLAITKEQLPYSNIDALVLQCTALHTMDLIQDLSELTGIYVISSNSAIISKIRELM